MNRDTVNTIRIAIYMRLSKEDERIQTESNSISMQRILLRKYINDHFGECQVLEYLDDGFSGTNFNRPGVQNLLKDAKNEKFDCIMVKDFSRFGRDYIELGSYLEQIFPFLGIRFISVNDHYDSANYQENIGDLDVNFKNLLYDMYSKDLSQKVKSAIRARKESGQYISGNAPFGYEKAPDDRHMLVIEEDEAEIVRKIFFLRLSGMTSSQVTKQLNLENVPTPIEFKIRKGKTSRKPKGDKFYWSNSVVYGILHNPVYVGDIEYGKTERQQVGGCNILKDRKDWKIIRNHHAPIITREDFEEVQKITQKVNRGQKKAEKSHSLRGMVVCGCCRRNLKLKKSINPYFTCGDRYVTGLADCVSKVNAMFLEQVVLYRLQEYIEKQNIAAEVVGGYMLKLKEKHADLLREMRQVQQEYDRLKQQHYESYKAYSLGKQTEFHSFHAEMEKKQERIRALDEQIIRIDERLHKDESGEAVPEQNLTLDMAEMYIEEIVVYDEENIEIKWKNSKRAFALA